MGELRIPRDGREHTDRLLADLRAGRWLPPAWGRFLGRSTVLSWHAVRARPRAAAQVTALHAAVFCVARGGRGRAWTGVSWALAITHLGLLGTRDGLGAANLLTVLRGNLPALSAGRYAGAAALISDLCDGRLARARGEVSAFGAYADAFADAAFWTWFALRYEPSRAVRAATLAAWAAPVAGVAAVSFGRGAMVEAPRPAVLRPAAAMQVVLTVRALRTARSGRPAR